MVNANLSPVRNGALNTTPHSYGHGGFNSDNPLFTDLTFNHPNSHCPEILTDSGSVSGDEVRTFNLGRQSRLTMRVIAPFLHGPKLEVALGDMDLAEIQHAIEELPKEQQAALAAWLAEREQGPGNIR